MHDDDFPLPAGRGFGPGDAEDVKEPVLAGLASEIRARLHAESRPEESLCISSNFSRDLDAYFSARSGMRPPSPKVDDQGAGANVFAGNPMLPQLAGTPRLDMPARRSVAEHGGLTRSEPIVGYGPPELGTSETAMFNRSSRRRGLLNMFNEEPPTGQGLLGYAAHPRSGEAMNARSVRAKRTGAIAQGRPGGSVTVPIDPKIRLPDGSHYVRNHDGSITVPLPATSDRIAFAAPIRRRDKTPPRLTYDLQREGIIIGNDIAGQVSQMGRRFAEETGGRRILVTSGYRNPDRQADAMYGKFEKGQAHIYKNKEALKEIYDVYQEGAANRTWACGNCF